MDIAVPKVEVAFFRSFPWLWDTDHPRLVE